MSDLELANRFIGRAKAKSLEKGVRQILDARAIPYFRVDFYRCPKCGCVFNHKAAGVPDFMAFWKGTAIAMECKSCSAVLSKEQRAWQAVLQSAGIRYFVIRQAEDVINILAQE